MVEIFLLKIGFYNGSCVNCTALVGDACSGDAGCKLAADSTCVGKRVAAGDYDSYV
jgi:hypothetical protein